MYKTELFDFLERKLGELSGNTSPIGELISSHNIENLSTEIREQLCTLIDTCTNPKICIIRKFQHYCITYGDVDKIAVTIGEEIAENRYKCDCTYREEEIKDCEVEIYGNLISVLNYSDNVIAIFCTKGVKEA